MLIRVAFFVAGLLILAGPAPFARSEPTPPANRLARETSPYLLLHAHNPVDWYPWGEEALARAKKENKPIFLSIGYSSCHWCHVMERESFMDREIAKVLNDNFVCIKVDREERPDLDGIYMTSVQVFNQITGQGRGGGWPMSVFLTPDLEPFFAGTYFPPRDGDRGAKMGFLTLVRKIQELWGKDAEKLRQDAKVITRFVKLELESRRPSTIKLNPKLAEETLTALATQFDGQHGGFGYDPENARRPKFPEPSNLVFLLGQARQDNTASAAARKMLEKTLDHMMRGGIWDHIGGGFHRYSVDRAWQIPHFEKMLYDNGQLVSVYAEAHQLTGRADYRRVVEQILAFIEREMTSPDGAFYAALDADSENEEGKFYRWTRDELRQALSEEEYSLFSTIYGLAGDPNFEEEYYVPQLSGPLTESAAQLKITETELEQRLVPIREKLLAVRDRRPKPLRDTKLLTSWNGLMIRGLADAGRLLNHPPYLDRARRAAAYLLENSRGKDGRLLRIPRRDESELPAYLDDYAFLVDGLLALHEATGEQNWLDAARELTDQQIAKFWDDQDGGFFFTATDHESLIARAKDPIDGAEPSGNSVAADNLLRLARLKPDAGYQPKAERTLQISAGVLQNSPIAAPRAASVIAGWKGEE